MENHQKFLNFNGKKIIFLSKDGTYWIAVRPILEALNMDADRSIKTLKNDPILGPARSIQTVQVSKNGQKQGRKMTCIPEKYVYGWIFSLNSDSPELLEYKKNCYELLYEHFHGTITNRKDLLLERNDIDSEIEQLENELQEHDEKFKKIKKLKSLKRGINTNLNSLDKQLAQQYKMNL